jgi:hypothetical protein
VREAGNSFCFPGADFFEGLDRPEMAGNVRFSATKTVPNVQVDSTETHGNDQVD